ncbi:MULTISPECIES: DUF4198 domain-containing protein [unclassified Methanoregula]|uniref:DUF4198 domain-containing protein n=1 Tax=unclassified Methanoregula TaxID=2649730 RepID=UPI0009CA5669|nr:MULTISPECIES: DUF4198 domain-containing protein [unclassified Methanoregula]OPX61836.1 MAG: Nickel uptake substrate-specific transmembrane region [Methanoregula sp. PtaB.Bin085]OPY35082.1 MAG: Nickel uptake substrate-specific transmembrane region [Methanoregula sp. PtaU1.Bin006]
MDKMVLMVFGHEIWLENVKGRGTGTGIRLMYGHNMKTDGNVDAKRISSVVYGPGRRKILPAIKADTDHHLVTFTGEKAGYYIPVVDLSPLVISKTKKDEYKQGSRKMYKDIVYAGAFHQMAKKIVPVGEVGRYTPRHVHGILDLIPERPVLTKGTNISMTLLYEGKPVKGVTVKAISKEEGKEMAAGITDAKGIVKFPVTKNGTWMFIARHNDPSKAVADEYDETVFVSTLVMETS